MNILNLSKYFSPVFSTLWPTLLFQCLILSHSQHFLLLSYILHLWHFFSFSAWKSTTFTLLIYFLLPLYPLSLATHFYSYVLYAVPLHLVMCFCFHYLHKLFLIFWSLRISALQAHRWHQDISFEIETFSCGLPPHIQYSILC